MGISLTRPCPICGATTGELLYTQSFADIAKVSFLKSYDVVTCDRCGLAFADRIPSQAAFDDYYNRQSKYEKTLSHNPDLDAVMENGLAFIRRFVAEPDARLLEIGCGGGDFLHYLKKNGFANLTALDPSASAVEHLVASGIAAHVGTISQSPLQASYDVVILLTVLEHIVDLQGALGSGLRLLQEGGLLFVRVPDVYRFADYDESPFQQFSPEHINYFSRVSAANLLGRYGYRLLGYEEAALRESDTTVLPMVNLMFRKETGSHDDTMVPDTATGIQLKRYVTLSLEREQAIDSKIQEFAFSQEPIVVWGVGTHTLRLLVRGSLKHCNIVAFVDSNVHYRGGEFHNISVCAPEDLYKYQSKILISSKVFQSEIASFIKNELKAPNDLILLY